MLLVEVISIIIGVIRLFLIHPARNFSRYYVLHKLYLGVVLLSSRSYMVGTCNNSNIYLIGTSYTNPNAQLSAKKGKPKPATRSRINDAEKSKGLVYDIEDDFESIQDIEKENKLINTDIKMLTPPRAEKRKKERKTKTTLSSTRINQSVNDNEDNEALKLRQFCEVSSSNEIHGNRTLPVCLIFVYEYDRYIYFPLYS